MGVYDNLYEEAVPDQSGRIPDLWSSLVGLAETQLTPSNVAAKRWLHIDYLGVPTLVEVDKHRVVAELGIRYRDLLILDPTVPTPSPCTLLIRDRALVANLEAVRLIICSNQVFVLSVPKASDPRVAAFPTTDNPFVKQLCKCLRTGRSTATLHDLNRNSAAFDYDAPYELRALEVGLATLTNILDRETFEVERDGYPAIDRFARNVDRAVLEEVRQVKQVMGRLVARVQRLRQELEEILEDDADMADMYLGRRAALLGEHPPADPLGLSTPRSQSSQSLAPKPHTKEDDAAHSAASGSRSPSQHEMPHPASAPSLASHRATAASTQQGSQAPHHPHSDGIAGAYPHFPQQGASHGGGTHSGAGPAEVQRSAAEHLGHHVHLRGDAPGSVAAGSVARERQGSSTAVKQWQRAGTVVRTVRTLRRRKPKGSGPGGLPTAVDAAEVAEQIGAAGNVMERAASAPPEMPSTEEDGEGENDGEEVIETIIEQPAGAAVDPHEIQDCEDLLESYFIQVDATLRRLMTLSERIDDAEDLVSIEMDHRRNELVATDLMVTIVSCAFGFCAVVGGVFGMNLHPFPMSRTFFWGVIVVMLAIGAALVLGILWWVRKRRLLFAPKL